MVGPRLHALRGAGHRLLLLGSARIGILNGAILSPG
jgi:hypothetical protein